MFADWFARNKERQKKTRHSSRKTLVLNIVVWGIIVASADVVCSWKITAEEWGDIGGFVIVLVVFLIGAMLFKTRIPLVLHIFIFPIILYFSWGHVYAQYDQQFQELREIQKFDILSEIMYREVWGDSDEYTQVKIFLITSDRSSGDIARLVRHTIDIASLRMVTEFSIFSHKKTLSSPSQNDYFFVHSMEVTTSWMPASIPKPQPGRTVSISGIKKRRVTMELGEDAHLLEEADYVA